METKDKPVDLENQIRILRPWALVAVVVIGVMLGQLGFYVHTGIVPPGTLSIRPRLKQLMRYY